MALLKLKCPECNAGLKSATGFTVGQTVCCPKCETYFAVEEPIEEEEEEEKPSKGKEKTAPAGKKPVKAAATDDEDEPKPKKKKKKKASTDEDEESGSYKKSPIRFVILGVLLLVMIVLGVMLFLKKRNEAAAEKPRNEEAAAQKEPTPIRPVVSKQGTQKEKNQVVPLPVKPPGNGGGGLNVADVAFDSLGGLLGGGEPVPFAQAQALTQKYKTALVGAWAANLGDGVTEELTYNTDGTFTARRAGPASASATGKYVVKNLVGTKGLRIQQDTAAGAREITVVFEDEELQHPSLQQGVTAVFRKK